MMQSNTEQMWQLYYGLGAGVWLGIWRTALDAAVAVRGKGKATCFLNDVLFCVSGMIVLFLISLSLCGGTIRLGMLIAAVIGCAAIHRLIAPYTVAVLHTVIRAICPIADRLSAATTRTGRKSADFAKKIIKNLKKGLRHALSLLYNKKRK